MNPIDVHELLENPGTAKSVHVTEPLEGLKLTLAEVDAPVDAGLKLEAVSEGVFVSGRLSGLSELTCSRCLKSFEAPFDVKVGELFSVDPTDDDDYSVTEPGEIDLEPMIRDAVLLSMPFSPLCREDCKGLCPRCGGDRNLGECQCSDHEIDPRWATLENFAENN